jgi:hypothetical protein
VEPSFLNHQERKSSRKSKLLIKADPLGCDAPNNGFCRPCLPTYPSLTADDISPFLDRLRRETQDVNLDISIMSDEIEVLSLMHRAASRDSLKYPVFPLFDTDDVHSWSASLEPSLARFGPAAVRPLVEPEPPVINQVFFESLLAQPFNRDNIAHAAYAASLAAGNAPAIAHNDGLNASAAAVAAANALVPGAVAPVPYTNSQLKFLFHTPGASEFYDDWEKDDKAYADSNHKLWGYMTESCGSQRDITAYIEKRLKELAASARLRLPGNLLLSEILVKFHRETSRDRMLTRESIYQLSLTPDICATDIILELEQIANTLKRQGVIIEEETLRDRLLIMMEHDPRYSGLAQIICTRIRFFTSAPVVPGAIAIPIDHGVSWEALKKEIRTIDLDSHGGYLNKPGKRTRPSVLRPVALNKRSNGDNTSDRSRSRTRSRSRDSRDSRGSYDDRARRNRFRRVRPQPSSHYQRQPPTSRSFSPIAAAATSFKRKSSFRPRSPHSYTKSDSRARQSSPAPQKARPYSPSRSVVSFQTNPVNKKAVECYICGREGHYAKNCLLKKQASSSPKARIALGYTSYENISAPPDSDDKNYASVALPMLESLTMSDSHTFPDSLAIDVTPAFLHYKIDSSDFYKSSPVKIHDISDFYEHSQSRQACLDLDCVFDYILAEFSCDLTDQLFDHDLAADLIDAACSYFDFSGPRRSRMLTQYKSTSDQGTEFCVDPRLNLLPTTPQSHKTP